MFRPVYPLMFRDLLAFIGAPWHGSCPATVQCFVFRCVRAQCLVKNSTLCPVNSLLSLISWDPLPPHGPRYRAVLCFQVCPCAVFSKEFDVVAEPDYQKNGHCTVNSPELQNLSGSIVAASREIKPRYRAVPLLSDVIVKNSTLWLKSAPEKWALHGNGARGAEHDS